MISYNPGSSFHPLVTNVLVLVNSSELTWTFPVQVAVWFLSPTWILTNRLGLSEGLSDETGNCSLWLLKLEPWPMPGWKLQGNWFRLKIGKNAPMKWNAFSNTLCPPTWNVPTSGTKQDTCEDCMDSNISQRDQSLERASNLRCLHSLSAMWSWTNQWLCTCFSDYEDGTVTPSSPVARREEEQERVQQHSARHVAGSHRIWAVLSLVSLCLFTDQGCFWTLRSGGKVAHVRSHTLLWQSSGISSAFIFKVHFESNRNPAIHPLELKKT